MAAPGARRRATIDVFGLVALAIFGLVAAVLLIRFTGITGGALGETHAARNVQELTAAAKQACRDGEAAVGSFAVPESYAYVARTCDLWECEGGRCEGETVPGTNWPLDGDSKDKVYGKFCNGSPTKNLLATCYIVYGVTHDWGPVGWVMGWKRIAAQKRSCEAVHCGTPYEANLMMPGKKSYRVNFVRDGGRLVGRQYDG